MNHARELTNRVCLEMSCVKRASQRALHCVTGDDRDPTDAAEGVKRHDRRGRSTDTLRESLLEESLLQDRCSANRGMIFSASTGVESCAKDQLTVATGVVQPWVAGLLPSTGSSHYQWPLFATGFRLAGNHFTRVRVITGMMRVVLRS